MTSTPYRAGGPAEPTLSGATASVAAAARVGGAVQGVIAGKPMAVRTALVVLLAGGHLLIEDVPGVGKTMLAKSLARALGCSSRRIQFTPDLLPSDVVGVNVYNRETREFEFKPGAIFAHIIVGDEINRASPKTQSALLECMEEGQVTVDGTTYLLARPFMVIATQNPAEMEGTYPLPEAQRDRFMACISMGYPDRASEIAMLSVHSADEPLEELSPVTSAGEVQEMIQAVRRVHAASALQAYVVDLVEATRSDPRVRLGASPRAALHLLRAARASAALDGRSYVLPDDVQLLAVSVLAHRLLLTSDAHLAKLTPAAIVDDLIRRVPVPTAT